MAPYTTYVLYGAVVVIVLVVLLFGGRAVVDAIRQKRIKRTIRENP
jgi:uncharacterized protein YneF (UPF0154 family)